MACQGRSGFRYARLRDRCMLCAERGFGLMLRHTSRALPVAVLAGSVRRSRVCLGIALRATTDFSFPIALHICIGWGRVRLIEIPVYLWQYCLPWVGVRGRANLGATGGKTWLF